MQNGIYFAGTYGYPITFQLKVSLTEVDSITLKVTRPRGASQFTRTIPNENITNVNQGTVFYTLQNGDIPDAGDYKIDLTITKSGGRVLTASTVMTVQ